MHTSKPVRFVLASASPARRKTLEAAGINPEVLVSGIDESGVPATDPERLCLTLAQQKADAVAEQLRAEAASGTDLLVLGCDSVLAFDGQILGKPADADEARARWRQMRGRAGVLHTGHSLIDVTRGIRADEAASTVVHFADLSDAEIEAYVATGEPLRVAGAFTIDGLGGPFVERIDGDPGTVVGLSLPTLRRLLAKLDRQITDLWSLPPATD